MKLRTGRRTGLVALVVGVGVAVGGIAYASIPDSDGLIHGCYNKTNGALRVIDTSGKGCSAAEKPLNWNQTGPTGAAGLSLFANIDEDGTLLSGTATGATKIGTGHYIVTFGRDVTACAPVATSGKVPGSDDGIPLATFLLHNDDTANPNDVEVYLIVPYQGTALSASAAFHLVVAC
jgi:hypothetical protein